MGWWCPRLRRLNIPALTTEINFYAVFQVPAPSAVKHPDANVCQRAKHVHLAPKVWRLRLLPVQSYRLVNSGNCRNLDWF
jgi:hypothetical protein